MPRLTAAPSRDILEAALQGLESQREKLDEQIAQVRAMMGGRTGRPGRPPKVASTQTASAPRNGRKKRTLTAEARKRIAAAQKKRWANFRKEQS